MTASDATPFVTSALRVIAQECGEIQALQNRIGTTFNDACGMILNCSGRVIVTGMGKSGHIGHKIAATLASTGTPSFFVHPGEASHGDLGMITEGDVVMAISNSGNSTEVLTLLPILKRRNIPLIALTGKPNSPLALGANIVLDIAVSAEACPLDLAPTSSTTVTLVLGDALAIALLEARGFTAEQFALSHPGGALGKRLLLTVDDVMHGMEKIPKVNRSTKVPDALSEISRKGFGITTIVDENDHLLGVFTDGDLRRALDQGTDIRNLTMDDVMSQSPSTVERSMLAAEALSTMERRKITALIVAGPSGKVCGILHLHDLLRAGIA